MTPPTRSSSTSATGTTSTRKPVAAIAAALLLLAGGGGAWWWWKVRVPPEAVAPHPLSPKQLETSIEQMQSRVKANPQDATGWAMLAHSLDMLGRQSDAGAAYAKLVELVPNDAQVLADYADSMAVARGRRLAGEPMKLVERALKIDPNNLKALALAGTEAYERQDVDAAVGYWQRALLVLKDPVLRSELEARIAEAKSGKGAAPASPVAALSPAAAASAAVTGRVALAAALKGKVGPDDTVFVFARPADGSKMPVALMRRKAGELPIDFRLDDSMAMVPQARLSTQKAVIVGARVSKRGDATPQPGDLQGFSGAVAPGTQGVALEIGEVVK